MADMSNIVDFNNSDGLSPDIVKKLNNNFFNMANKIVGSDIVMSAGINPPDPRTNETLFYKTDTGDLYIWAKYVPLDPTEDIYWDWMKIDVNVFTIGTSLPYPRTNETMFYDTTTGELYIWAKFTPIDPDTQDPQDPYWDWMKVDLNLIEPVSEYPSGIRDGNAFIKYYITDTDAYPYFWIDYGSEIRAQWVSLIDLIEHYANSEGLRAAKSYIENMTMQDWLDLPNFENAVRYIINHPSNP